MALKETLQQLGAEKNNPCVSISMNTHRTRPKTDQDKILLKNLLKEAHDRVSKEYDKSTVESLLNTRDCKVSMGGFEKQGEYFNSVCHSSSYKSIQPK